MQIINSELSDINQIFELYRIATEYMKSKNQVAWPEFSQEMVQREIEECRQWKLILDGQMACIWATALEDELIWGTEYPEPSVYIHRIATNPSFRGQKFVSSIVQWAQDFCLANKLQYIRLDTVGSNQGLINHYQNSGFEFLGTRELSDTDGLPVHYNEGPVCLFQKKV